MTVKPKFIVLSHGRTGSTYLVEELDRHPSIRMFSEIFHETRDQRPDVNGKIWHDGMDSWDFVQDNVYSRRPHGALTTGFKLFYFHVCGADNQIWNELQNDRSISPILLHRKNIFASFVSEERARNTNVWHPTGKDGAYEVSVGITLDVGKAREFHDRTMAEQQFGKKLVADREHFFMTYEDLLEDAPGILGLLLDYLGLSSDGWEPAPFHRGSADKYRTQIANIDEVSDFLKEKDALWMLKPFV